MRPGLRLVSSSTALGPKDQAARLLRQLATESLRRLTQKGLEGQLTPEDVIAEHGAEPKVWRPMES